ncbi:MAG: hypothetical protein WCK64_03015 [Synechococcaceae cyanobacterium ELA445]
MSDLKFNLFGATSFCGQAFQSLLADWGEDTSIHAYSRDALGYLRADLFTPECFLPDTGLAHSFWISFAPIWTFASFFERFADARPDYIPFVSGVVACSSSSVLTKRYSSNDYDKSLVLRLGKSEDLLLSTCDRLGVPCRILRPSLIYGKAGSKGDRNLSRIINLMRRLPILPLPACTGLRQPIHVSQLAEVTLEIVKQLATSHLHSIDSACLALGGDSELTYTSMLLRLQQSLPFDDPARRCLLLPVPNRLFFFLAAPMLFHSPKLFEAVLRMGADLAGFMPSHQLLNLPAKSFPVLPFS